MVAQNLRPGNLPRSGRRSFAGLEGNRVQIRQKSESVYGGSLIVRSVSGKVDTKQTEWSPQTQSYLCAAHTPRTGGHSKRIGAA
jgi:hypothetical protein